MIAQTVQEKLAGVVAGIPRSPKDVQTTVHDVTTSLLQEVEKIQQTVSSSAKGLVRCQDSFHSLPEAETPAQPANVQSAVSPLFDQLSHAVNDIVRSHRRFRLRAELTKLAQRAELNRSDVPLTTRAANILNYSRTNTEKALREALDRVSALLRNNKSEAEKTVDQASDKASEAVNDVSKKTDQTAGDVSKKANQATNKASKKADKAQSGAKKATS